jgi:hypothetical protein
MNVAKAPPASNEIKKNIAILPLVDAGQIAGLKLK